MESMTITLSGDLYASLKILVMYETLADSVYPSMASGEISLTNGKSDDKASEAARAVLPLCGGP